MGMDAKAYLFYGTKPVEDWPESVELPGDDSMDDYERTELLAERVRMDFPRIQLVYPSNDYPWYALALTDTSIYHDWDYGPTNLGDKFSAFVGGEPTTTQLEACIKALGWPESKLGWWLMADYS